MTLQERCGDYPHGWFKGKAKKEYAKCLDEWSDEIEDSSKREIEKNKILPQKYYVAGGVIVIALAIIILLLKKGKNAKKKD